MDSRVARFSGVQFGVLVMGVDGIAISYMYICKFGFLGICGWFYRG